MNSTINAASDIFVKYLLGSEKNKSLLISFINAVLEDSDFKKIVSVEIKNPFTIKNFKIDKESILDIKAADETGRQYDIEVQLAGDESFKWRSLYYWSRIYSSQLKEKESYTKLNPVICINVLDFDLLDEKEGIHKCFLLRELKNPDYILTDHIILHFLELTKLSEKIEDDKLKKWLLFLKYEGKREDLMEILIKEDKDIAKAHEEYKHFSEDEKLRDLYESRLMWQRDYYTAMETAREEGIVKGIQKGREEGREEGEIKKSQSAIIRLLSKKFGISREDEEFIKTINDIEKLDNAIDEILFAKNKEAILDILK